MGFIIREVLQAVVEIAKTVLSPHSGDHFCISLALWYVAESFCFFNELLILLRWYDWVILLGKRHDARMVDPFSSPVFNF